MSFCNGHVNGVPFETEMQRNEEQREAQTRYARGWQSSAKNHAAFVIKFCSGTLITDSITVSITFDCDLTARPRIRAADHRASRVERKRYYSFYFLRFPFFPSRACLSNERIRRLKSFSPLSSFSFFPFQEEETLPFLSSSFPAKRAVKVYLERTATRTYARFRIKNFLQPLFRSIALPRAFDLVRAYRATIARLSAKVEFR